MKYTLRDIQHTQESVVYHRNPVQTALCRNMYDTNIAKKEGLLRMSSNRMPISPNTGMFRAIMFLAVGVSIAFCLVLF
jgi:hypothetical protein